MCLEHKKVNQTAPADEEVDDELEKDTPGVVDVPDTDDDHKEPGDDCDEVLFTKDDVD